MQRILLTCIYIAIWALIMYVSLKCFKHFDILDKPGPDVPKRSRVPTLQWVSIVFAFFVLIYISKIYLWLDYIGKEFLWLFVWGGLICLISVIDELWRIVHKRFRVSALIRFALQILLATAAWYWSGVGLDVINIWSTYIELGWFTSRLWTVVWFLLFINAINRFDGVYGLASGVSSIWFLAIFLLLHTIVMPGFTDMSFARSELLLRTEVIALMLAALAAIATVVEYKPMWLMRDAWSMFFWFCLAYLSLLWWAKIGTMLVVLCLPLFDAIWVVLSRLRRWGNPMKWDHTHFHYRLMALWWGRGEVRCFIWWVTATLLILTLLQWSHSTPKIIIFVLVWCIFFWSHIYLYWIKWLPEVYDWKIMWKTKK